jgi:hypothetical protein
MPWHARLLTAVIISRQLCPLTNLPSQTFVPSRKQSLLKAKCWSAKSAPTAVTILWAKRSSLGATSAGNANELDLDFRHHGLFSFVLAIPGGDRSPRDLDETSSGRGAIILVDGSDFRNRRGNRSVELWMEAYMKGLVS